MARRKKLTAPPRNIQVTTPAYLVQLQLDARQAGNVEMETFARSELASVYGIAVDFLEDSLDRIVGPGLSEPVKRSSS